MLLNYGSSVKFQIKKIKSIMKFINKTIVQFVKILPKSIVYIFAKQYIAGVNLSDAVRIVKQLNEKGIRATVDVLGESVDSKEAAIKAGSEVIEVLNTIDKNKLDANISVKLTQLGLLLGEDFCYEQVEKIIGRAKELNNFVRIDMEDSSVTDATLNVYRKAKKNFGNVGIVLQAYLRRTLSDIDKLNSENTNFRLCKGIYVEPKEIAFKEKDEVRQNYLTALNKIFDAGNYVGIATHDKYLTDNAQKIISERKLSNDKYEFQMLYGVTEKLRDQIKSSGHKIRVYVPFGEHWYPYSIRRLQENPTMAWYITKSLFLRR